MLVWHKKLTDVPPVIVCSFPNVKLKDDLVHSVHCAHKIVKETGLVWVCEWQSDSFPGV